MSTFLTTKEQTITERVLVTGVCNSQIIAINPDKEELAEIINRNPDDVKEPSYTSEKDGVATCRLDIWMRPVEGTEYFDSVTKENKSFTEPYKLAIFVSDKERESAAGNKSIINGKIQTTWAKTIEEAVQRTNKAGNQWFSETSARFAKEGEEQLYDLFAKFVNANLRDEETDLVFTDFDAIIHGDVSELREIVDAKTKEGKSINVLLGVNNGIYQEVYPNGFARGDQRTFSRLIEAANGEYGAFRADFMNNPRLQAYIRPVEPQSDGAMPENESTDDLPF